LIVFKDIRAFVVFAALDLVLELLSKVMVLIDQHFELGLYIFMVLVEVGVVCELFD
jgi:hypothetical protein